MLTDPKTKLEVTTPEDIKRVSLEYCSNLLTNREPKEEYTEDIRMKKLIHQIRLGEEANDDMEELAVSRFNKTYDALAKKPGSKYDFIVKGGVDLKAALLKLCQVVWRSEMQPDMWCKLRVPIFLKMC